ncbi:hypothetical protein [Peribacillus sp. NPDC096540]|uniref:hypothetical protein n=1 Tax=Peribacillus sp. NPDC096540 TaxID=3390612 RepID=UPI003D0159DB
MFISPMLLHKTEQTFEKNDLITELEVTTKFPNYVNIPFGTILDSEIIMTDQQCRPDFEAMMQRFQSKE